MTVRPSAIKSTRIVCLQIFLFAVLAHLLPLGCLFLMYHTALGETGLVHFILFGMEAASPTIAAIMTVLFFEKPCGVKKFFCSNFSPKLKRASALGCIIVLAVIMFTAKTISCLLLKAPFEMAALTFRQVAIIAWAFVAEEIGWRGFLQKKLTVLFHERLVPLLVGIIWAVWHYHFFMTGTIEVAIPLFIAGCVVDSYLYAALLKISRGNILIAMIFHMAGNFFIHLFLINPNVNGGSLIPYTAYVVLSAIFAIGITAVLNRPGFTKNNY